MLFWGRLPVVALSALLGLYVFLWGRALHGDAGGLTALGLFAFSSNLLAHSHLVTMDMALTCFALRPSSTSGGGAAPAGGPTSSSSG